MVSLDEGKEKLAVSISPAAADQLVARPGSVLSGAVGSHVLLVHVAEWALMERRIMHLEAHLHREFSQVSEGAPTLAVLEKTGGAMRYQIMPEALRGRFKHLGAVFELLRDSQQLFHLNDFQI